ncbi:Hypothetical_protein [Hexamita inflata]|uniref:Hypothetical_protein n=1 Tax=Hexamita inflata TaxID=28002 RepID=A0AA86UYW2_9EUKA|nr:Hypothetical protein HINF_LOCUS57632 [Hexamita inflata]
MDNYFSNQQHTDVQLIRTNNNQQSQHNNYKLLLTSNPLIPLKNQQCRRNEIQIKKRRQISIIQIRKVFKNHGVFNSINSHKQECTILQIRSKLLLSVHLNCLHIINSLISGITQQCCQYTYWQTPYGNIHFVHCCMIYVFQNDCLSVHDPTNNDITQNDNALQQVRLALCICINIEMDNYFKQLTACRCTIN